MSNLQTNSSPSLLTPQNASLLLTEAKRNQAIRQARKSLGAFTEYLELGFLPASHHRLLIEKLEAVERGEIRRLMVFMPPGSAKSTYASVLFPAWVLGKQPQLAILSASHTTDLAEKFGRRVRNIVADNPYKAVFDTRLAQDSQAAGRWATADGGEYYAAGVGAAILGYRADLGIIDDPVAGREEADSELVRTRTWEWYKSDFYTRLKPNAAVILIMQRWREDDLAGMLLEDAKNGGEQWDVLRLPMEAEEADVLGRAVGEPLWPEWFTDEMRNQAKRDARNWLALYQQRPRPDSGGEFKKDWLRYYKNKPEKTNNYIIVDPAGEKKQGRDYTAVWVLGCGRDGKVYALDIIRDRMSLTERTELLFKLHRKYQPLKVGYEKYGKDSDVEHIRDVMEREQYRFEVEELGGALKKEDRIRRIIPMFEGHEIYLPQSLHYTDHQNVVRDLVQDFIEQEYAPFPVGKHDDLMDALSRVVDMRMSFPKALPEVVESQSFQIGSEEVAWLAS